MADSGYIDCDSDIERHILRDSSHPAGGSAYSAGAPAGQGIPGLGALRRAGNKNEPLEGTNGSFEGSINI